MIQTFKIRNFLSIRALDLGMKRFMALVGPNGAGKTNVVRALGLFGDVLASGTTEPASEVGWDQIIRRSKKPARGGLTLGAEIPLPRSVVYRTLRRQTIEKFRTEFPKGTIVANIELTLGGSVGDAEVQVVNETLTLTSPRSTLEAFADKKGIAVRSGDDPLLWEMLAPRLFGRYGTRNMFTSVTSESDARDILTEYLSERSLSEERERRVLRILNWQRFYSPWLNHCRRVCQVRRVRLDASALRSDSSFRDVRRSQGVGPQGEGLASSIYRLKNGNAELKGRFKELMVELQQVYPQIQDVTAERIRPGALTLFFKESGISDELGMTNVSDGVLHALALLLLLLSSNSQGGILVIEEPENAIHPWSVRAMMRIAQRQETRQIIVTTHSETVVNAVSLPSSLFIVENDPSMGTVVDPAENREHALGTILRETGQKLGDVWMDGSIGGVPTPVAAETIEPNEEE